MEMVHAESDFLVIGSGLAGLVFALEAANYGQVTVLAKEEAGCTNTAHAQGGIAAVLSAADSFESHISDTLVAGCGLNNLKAVELLVKEAPKAIAYLQRWQVPFCQTGSGLDLHLEGGHSFRRIAHVHDQTGFSLQQHLLRAAQAHPNIQILEHRFAIDLQLSASALGERICTGVLALHTQTNRLECYSAQATLLATGGLGQVYARTTNPAVATADGLGMAARAGLKVKDLEFVQFHPTALYTPKHEPVFLISEAVRGEGGELRNAAGHAFMKTRHPLGSLAPRDVVALAIAEDLAESGEPCVFLDLSSIPEADIPTLFPTIYQTCLQRGIDCTKQPIPVAPAAHYGCGGICTDLWGQTSLKRLFAAGEVAHTGVHGANRLASNSLLEAVVFGLRSAEKAAVLCSANQMKLPPQTDLKLPLPQPIGVGKFEKLKREVQHRMWESAGLVRHPKELQKLNIWLGELLNMPALMNPNRYNKPLLELRNLVQAAKLITEAAVSRKNSIGGHFIVQNDEVIRLKENGNFLQMSGLPELVDAD